jgi:hypothetical protein
VLVQAAAQEPGQAQPQAAALAERPAVPAQAQLKRPAVPRAEDSDCCPCYHHRSLRRVQN